MGQARIKELKTRELAFSKTRNCIFCGGETQATTVDHCPPRSMFVNRQWPEGYVFPACESCNTASREDEKWVAFMSRLDPGFGEANEDSRVIMKNFESLANKYPGEIREMFNAPTAKIKRLASRIGLKPQVGELYRDLPIVTIPERAHSAVESFGRKLTKALHFEVTQKVVPSNAGLKLRWFTNASLMEGVIPEEVFWIPNQLPTLKRGKTDLSNSFVYRYAVSEDGTFGTYTMMFRFAFCITSVVTFDPDLLSDL